MTSCCHHKQPAVSLGLVLNHSSVLSLLLLSKTGFGLGVLTMKADGASWQVLQSSLHFPLPPKRVLTVPRRGGCAQQPVPQGRSRWWWPRSQSCAFVLPAGSLLWPLGGAQGGGRSWVTCEPFIRTWPNPGGASVLTGHKLRRNSIGECHQLSRAMSCKAFLSLLKSKNYDKSPWEKCFQH